MERREDTAFEFPRITCGEIGYWFIEREFLLRDSVRALGTILALLDSFGSAPIEEIGTLSTYGENGRRGSMVQKGGRV